MAQRVITTSDVSGQEPAETITFALEGVQYEVDLTTEEKAALVAALEPYTSAGRRVGRSGSAPSRTRSSGRGTGGAPTGVDPKSVRAWAACYEGMTLPAQGRIPRTVIDQYLNPSAEESLTPVKGVDKDEIKRQEDARSRAQAAYRAANA